MPKSTRRKAGCFFFAPSRIFRAQSGLSSYGKQEENVMETMPMLMRSWWILALRGLVALVIVMGANALVTGVLDLAMAIRMRQIRPARQRTGPPQRRAPDRAGELNLWEETS
ncbi:hypothetical protein [Pseudoduganella sp. UC29_71]|uniref:hypothetical protein n=1 Tax=Pseudoduganella sp. UC29_71 TaxID=3350174 RepID=UPI00367074D8